jgi:hypothetical protein
MIDTFGGILMLVVLELWGGGQTRRWIMNWSCPRWKEKEDKDSCFIHLFNHLLIALLWIPSLLSFQSNYYLVARRKMISRRLSKVSRRGANNCCAPLVEMILKMLHPFLSPSLQLLRSWSSSLPNGRMYYSGFYTCYVCELIIHMIAMGLSFL